MDTEADSQLKALAPPASDAAEKPGSTAVGSGGQAARPQSLSDEEGTLVTAESLTAAYKALGNAALPMVHGSYSSDPLI